MMAAHYKGAHHPGNDLGLHYTALPPIVASCPYSDQLLVTRKFWSPGANRPSQAKPLSVGVALLDLVPAVQHQPDLFAADNNRECCPPVNVTGARLLAYARSSPGIRPERKIRCAPDSPLEKEGFELSVPFRGRIT